MTAPQQPSVPPAEAPSKKMSTGAKVAIGCAAFAGLAVLAVVAVVGVGYFFVSQKAGELRGGIESQQRASETIQELERRHAFAPPAEGVIVPERARQFFAVTDAAWEELRDWVADMDRRGERIQVRGSAGIRDAAAAVSGMARARVILAEALAHNDIPPSEYVWTGLALARAFEELDSPTGRVPEANRRLAERYREELAELREGFDDEHQGRAAVLALAFLWASTEGAFQLHSAETLPDWLR